MTDPIIVGVVSDTHISNLREVLPPALFKIFEGVDLILHAGDITSLHVIRELESIAPVEAVCGNMDPASVSSLLPDKRLITIGKNTLGLIHGRGAPFGIRGRIRAEFGPIDAIVYGHTHSPYAAWEKGIFYFNPGTAAKRALSGTPTCGKLIVAETIRGEIFSL